ncbi:MAG: efflux RND transporter permease subunit [Pseudomonadota bacterium]
MFRSDTPNLASTHGLTGWFIANPVAANLLMIVLLVGGFLAAASLKTEEFPTLEIKAVSINVAVPGATPKDVEESVTKRLEQAVLGVNGIKEVKSSSGEGRASIEAELTTFADLRLVRDQIESAVDRVRAFLPDTAEAPIISVPTQTDGVVTFALFGQASELKLLQEAQRLEQWLLSAPGVSLVSVLGTREREIVIEVDEDTLQAYEIGFAEIAAAIRAGSIDISAGELRADSGSILLRSDQRRTDVEALSTLIIRSDEAGRELRLSEIADVSERFVRQDLSNTFNGQPSVMVEVSRSSEESLLDVRNAVAEAMEGYTSIAGVEIVEFQDQTTALRDRLGMIMANAVTGFALVLIFLSLVIDLRLAFWISVGIATAFLGGFILSSLAGVSMNGIALFGLLVAIGLVVDDAIVVGEAIDVAKAQGKSAEEAAKIGLQSVRAPVIVGVATTVAAFSPLLLTTGELADFVRHIPIIVMTTLLVSLVEAFFILPSHLAHGRDWSKPPLKTIQSWGAQAMKWIASSIVRPVARQACTYRYLTFGIAIAFMFMAFSLIENGRQRVIFFPTIEPDAVSAFIEMPVGSPYAATERAAARLESAAYDLAADLEATYDTQVIKNILVTKGGRLSGIGSLGGGVRFRADEATASVQLELAPGTDRPISAAQIEAKWRTLTGPIPAAKDVSYRANLLGFGSDVAFNLTGPDHLDLEEITAELRDRINALDGVRDVQDSIDLGKREFLFSLTPAGVASGLTTNELARQIRQSFFGEEIDRIQRGREELRVVLRYPNDVTSSFSTLDTMRVRLPDNQAAPLATVAKFEETRSAARVRRVDGRRVLTVEADVDESTTTPDAINQIIRSDVLPDLSKKYPGLIWQVAGAAEAQNEDTAGLGGAFLMAMIIIYGIIAVQLRAYVMPLAILFSVPIALTGAVFGHTILGYPISFLSMFGIIALAGVAVNASIVLIDNYQRRRAMGETRIDAASSASEQRFRAIFLTTLTTALGLAPILSETSPQAQFLVPIAVSLGSGILFSGVFVLFVTPALALIIDDLAMPFRRN